MTIDPSLQRLDRDHPEYTFHFDGIGFVVKGSSEGKDQNPVIKVLVDGILSEQAVLPSNFTKRRHDVCWKYNLMVQKHTVTIRLINPEEGDVVLLDKVLVYRQLH